MLEKLDQQLFELSKTTALALTFTSERPPGLERAPGPPPSSCTLWKLAEAGRAFYAEAGDHFGCPLGAYVLGADLPEMQAQDLENVNATMVKLGYMTEKEIRHLPRRRGPLRYVIYAPLGASPTFPDLVIVRGKARELMLLCEAARAAGVLGDSITVHPACSIIPRCMGTMQVELTLGCVGNRVYTGLEDHEGYVAIPGNALEATCKELETIVRANDALKDVHHQRQSRFAVQM